MASQKIRGTNLLNRVYNPKEMFKNIFLSQNLRYYIVRN